MFISPLKISPLAKKGGLIGLAAIFADSGALNMWSSENITIDGTDTTVHDYAEEHDLVNPAAANQPTFTASNASLGGKPTLDHDGTTDYLYKAVSDYRGSDTTGVIIQVLKYNSGSQFFGSCDEASTDIINNRIISTKYNHLHNSGDVFNGGVTGTTVIGAADVKVFASSCDAVDNKVWLNGVDDTATDTIGGGWFDDMPLRDNITIGAAKWTSLGYSNIEWACTLYMPYTTDAKITEVSNSLKDYYGF